MALSSSAEGLGDGLGEGFGEPFDEALATSFLPTFTTRFFSYNSSCQSTWSEETCDCTLTSASLVDSSGNSFLLLASTFSSDERSYENQGKLFTPFHNQHALGLCVNTSASYYKHAAHYS